MLAICILVTTLEGGCIAASAPLASGPSISGLWPRLDQATASGATPLQLTADFSFRCSRTSAKLDRAFARYTAAIVGQRTLWTRAQAPSHTLPLRSLEVVVDAQAQLEDAPQLGDDESFVLRVSDSAAQLHASSFGGVQHGLETFAQLTVRLGGMVLINSTTTHVRAAPQFAYRGIMVDSGRHFLPVPQLLHLLDGMAASRLNVLHWHLTDAQSFAWNSSTQPLLVRGAYRPDLTYQHSDLVSVVAYAADRAIRVVPEIDMPGHAASFAMGRPDVVVSCTPDDSAPDYDGSYQSTSQLDPSNNATFQMLHELVGELAGIFPDNFVHFGGDEVQFECYNSSARVKQWMRSMGWDSSCPPHARTRTRTPTRTRSGALAGGEEGEQQVGSSNPCSTGGVGYKKMMAYFIRRVQSIARSFNKQPAGWQEIFDHYGGDSAATPTPPIEGLDPNTVIYDWLAPGWGWANAGTITAKGWRAVSTLGLYLSSDTDNQDWLKYYGAHPLSSSTNSSASHGRGWFNVTSDKQKQLVLGGEACLWGEQTNGDNLNLRAWPRATAMAEALWSGWHGNATEALPRLLRQRCRMVQRGVPVTPLQPGFC